MVPLRFVRSCSAPLNVAAALEMERTFGAPVLSAYGMTETAHQATSQPLPQRGPVKHGSVGGPTGVRVRIIDPDGRTCSTGNAGEVWVNGPTVARGYLANPADTARNFVDGWFRTGDLGALDEDGHLFLTGRIKNIINRGGEKISPEHVEAVLAECRGVTEAAVFAIPDATYGERVGAAVVVAEGESVAAEEILEDSRNRLAPFEVPERLDSRRRPATHRQGRARPAGGGDPTGGLTPPRASHRTRNSVVSGWSGLKTGPKPSAAGSR